MILNWEEIHTYYDLRGAKILMEKFGWEAMTIQDIDNELERLGRILWPDNGPSHEQILHSGTDPDGRGSNDSGPDTGLHERMER